MRPSLCELADLTARQILTERDQEEAGQQLLKQSRREIVVLSLGPGTRCWLRWKDASGLRLFRSPARSTLGVGDSALAGVVVGLWRGMPPRDAIRIGMAAGATALQGSDTQLRRRSDVERLYNEEGLSDDRYACFFDLDTWRDYVTSAGFEEVGHYYRPPGLPRHKQPWLATVWRKA